MTDDDTALLSGIRVLDLSQGIAGPYCGAILQQQGAEVVKLEPPAGDWARRMGTVRQGSSAIVLAYNAGKRGLCVDAGTSAGRAAILRLAAQVDIVIQNFRHGVVDRLGIGHAQVAALNPRGIYVSVSGFGSSGPLADSPATDTVMQSFSGMTHLNRGPTGIPQRGGLLLADLATALYAAQLCGAALFRRSIDGRGRHLELSLLEACAALQASAIADSVLSAGQPRLGAATAPSGIFPVADGFLTLAALDDAMYARLCRALGDAEAAANPLYASQASRLTHADALNRRVGALLQGEPLAHWLPRLKAADVLHAPVLDHAQFMQHEQVLHSQLFTSIAVDEQLTLPRARHPGTRPAPGMVERAPAIGEHSAAVLRDFRFSEAEIDALLQSGAVRQA